MAIKALSLAAIGKHICSFDDPSNPTEFSYGVLDSRVSGFIQDEATTFGVDTQKKDDETSFTVKVSHMNSLTVQYGLRGWSNFKDDKGNDVEFKTITVRHGGTSYEVVDPVLMRSIPTRVISELSGIIREFNGVTDAEGNV